MIRFHLSGICCLLFTGLFGAPALALEAGAGETLEVKLETLEGVSQRLSDLRGRRLLIELWATWCTPCQEQARIVRGAADEMMRLGVEVLAVNVGENRKKVARAVSESPPYGRVLLDRGQRMSRLLDLEALPAVVVLREDGVVVAAREGLVSGEELREMLAAAFAEQKVAATSPDR